MNFTDAQKSAIEAKDPFIIVSAAAGSGKTRVLTERVVSRLCDENGDCDISRFLIVTFTRAAAAEMRTRIASSLAERISAGEKGSDRLRRQLAKLPTAHIQTVDSFCADFVRRHFDLCGVPSDFGICDSLTAEDLKSKALFNLLEETYEKDPAGFRLLRLSVCGERSDKALEETLVKTYDKIQSHPDPAEWIIRRRDEEGLPVFKTDWGSFILAQAERLSFPVIGRWKNAKAAAAQDPAVAEKNLPLITVFDALCTALENISDPTDLSPYVACLSDYANGIKGKRVSGPRNNAAYERFVNERDACKKAIEKLSSFISDCTADPDAFENLPSRGAAVCFCDMLLRFDLLYAEEKRAKKLLDYADLEHMTLKTLRSHPETAQELRSELCELLVDEYQDTNEVQDEIFRLIAPEQGSSFFVGDLKQSIYGFRLADPSIFLRRYREATPDGRNGKRRIDMFHNFRSRPEVIDLCNSVFGKIMSEKLGGIDYDETQALVCGRGDVKGSFPSELCVIDRDGGPDAGGDDSYAALEAAYTAKRIRKLLSSARIPDGKGGERGVLPEDCAILLSSYRSNADIFLQALDKEGIPCAADSEKDLAECPEGRVIYSLLKIIDNPRQDVPLLAVLYSPLFSFTPDELALLRSNDRYCDLIDSVTLAAKNGNEKADAFLKQLSEWTFLSRLLTASRLLQRIYSDTDAYGVFSALPAAQTRRQTLDLIYDLALSRESGSFCSLYDFVSYLEKAELSQSKPVFSSGSGVRVMSIHRSKGLEFPFVFVCMLDKDFNTEDNKDPVLTDKDVGLALRFVDVEKRIKRPSGKFLAVKEKMLSESASEEMRKLYVAMTRAREGLFLILSTKDPAGKVSDLYDCCRGDPSPGFLAGFKSCGPWILSALLGDPDAGPLMSLTRDAGKKTTAPRGSFVCTVTDRQSVYEALEKDKLPGAADEKGAGQVPESAEISAYAALSEKEYPFSDVSALPSKMTPAALSESKFSERAPGDLFAPSGEGRDAALARGTALHAFLSRADLEKCVTEAGVNAEKERLSDVLPDASSVDGKAVLGFTLSELGRRALSAPELLREYRFGVLLSPARIPELNNAREDERILVNGSVDMLFFEKDGAVIIDFKTDSVRPGLEAQAAEKHRPQLRLYAEAVKEVFGTPVAATVVFFLKTGAAVSL